MNQELKRRVETYLGMEVDTCNILFKDGENIILVVFNTLQYQSNKYILSGLSESSFHAHFPLKILIREERLSKLLDK